MGCCYFNGGIFLDHVGGWELMIQRMAAGMAVSLALAGLTGFTSRGGDWRTGESWLQR